MANDQNIHRLSYRVKVAAGAPTITIATASGTGTRILTPAGTPSFPALIAEGFVLAAPTELYTGNTEAQTGSNNPTNITDKTPAFSFNVTKLADNITEVRIQVSAAGDHDFSETVHWDSGWVALGTEQITDADLDTDNNARIPDIEYGTV
jgi:hypothetical protein